MILSKAAAWSVRRTLRDGFRYSKAGIVTVDLVPLAPAQRALIGGFDQERGGALMEAFDACNRRRGCGAVVPGSAGIIQRRKWSTKFEMRSPRYTTRVEELPMVRAA